MQEILNFLEKLSKENYKFEIPNEKCRIALIKAIEEMSKFENFMGILNHTLRVASNALLLAKRKRLNSRNKEILFLSAIFHDVYKMDEGKHTIKGAEFAKKILKSLDYSDDFCNEVYSAIIKHTESFLKPEKITEKILYDADKLDKIGVFGILRRTLNSEDFSKDKEKILKRLKEDTNQKFYLKISKKIAEERIKNEKEILKF
ncbi:MAG: HD domain-containing protein [Candidatus Altarchaeaceae archaeon]